jgi:4-amino-4-deoxy-L-arabinose transferase-like glycosyltransferase
VAVGILTLVAVHRLAARQTGDVRVADLAAVFYIVCPFALFHDRMVLTDPYLSAFTAWTLLLSLRLADAPRLRDGAWLGAAMALGIAAKVTGLPLLAVPLLVLIVMGATGRAWIKPLGLAYGVAIALIAFPVWRFFSRPSGELSKLAGAGGDDSSVVATVSANLGLALSWLWRYWTPGLVLLAAAGVAAAVRTSALRRGGVLLILMGLGPVALFAGVSRVWFPRYVLFTTVPLVILGRRGLPRPAGRDRPEESAPRGDGLYCARPALLAISLASALRFDAALWNDPSARAPARSGPPSNTSRDGPRGMARGTPSSSCAPAGRSVRKA